MLSSTLASTMDQMLSLTAWVSSKSALGWFVCRYALGSVTPRFLIVVYSNPVDIMG